MIARSFLLLAALATLAAPGVAQDSKTVPNHFFAGRKPTFVVGTLGDDACDRKIRAQVDLIRGMIFPDAPVVEDVSIDLAKGLAAWPEDPVLYGGPHVNAIVKSLAARMPIRIGPGKIVLGAETFEGDEFRIITVVPGRAAEGGKPAFPPFLLYAGAGTPGVAEINGIRHGGDALLLADRFGVLAVGTYETDAAGTVEPKILKRGRRLPWRDDRPVELRPPEPCPLVVSRLVLAPAEHARERLENAACLRGLERARTGLSLEDPVTVLVHIYPDRGSKRTLTGDPGDGRADVESRSLHVLRADPKEGGPLESLIAHEATHILAYHGWGAAGTPLFGEGLAVWVAGNYGGRTLEQWKARLPAEVPKVEKLLGPAFRRLPEATTYPLAGLLTETLIEAVGRDRYCDHLYPATPRTFAEACKAAGTTPEKVEALFRKALGR